MAYVSGIGAISLPAIPGLPPPPEQLASIVSQVTGGQVQLASGAAPAPAAAPKAAEKTIIPGVPDMAVYVGGAAILAGLAWMAMSKPAMRSNPGKRRKKRRKAASAKAGKAFMRWGASLAHQSDKAVARSLGLSPTYISRVRRVVRKAKRR